jgi:hypothetical protein
MLPSVPQEPKGMGEVKEGYAVLGQRLENLSCLY